LTLFFVSAFSVDPYCVSGPTTTVDSTMGPVELIGNSQSITDNTSCTGKTPGPWDLTTLTADLTPGLTYTLKFNVTTCGNYYPTLSGAWIDYNQNGLFETDESLFVFQPLMTGGVQEKPFSPPTTALLGRTVMRVQVQETQATTMDPCAQFPYGGTKDFSIEIGSVSPYCSSGPTLTADANLGSTQLQGETLAIFETSDCPGKVGVQDFTDQFADLKVGTTYTLKYNSTTCGGVFLSLSGAWIDWNQDNIYDDNDQLFPFVQGFGVISQSFTVPATAYEGETRMRVQVQETTSPSIKPCDMFSYGGTKDFSIIVKGNLPYCMNCGPATIDATNLGKVFLQGESKNIEDNTDCPGHVGPQDLTTQFADLLPGTSYVIDYNVTSCGVRQLNELSGAWIDYDANGAFTTNEALFPFSNYFGFQERIFTTPDEFPYLGKTRLRVQVQTTSEGATTLNPCAHFLYGGTKDFSVNLLKPEMVNKKKNN